MLSHRAHKLNPQKIILKCFPSNLSKKLFRNDFLSNMSKKIILKCFPSNLSRETIYLVMSFESFLSKAKVSANQAFLLTVISKIWDNFWVKHMNLVHFDLLEIIQWHHYINDMQKFYSCKKTLSKRNFRNSALTHV